MENESNIVISGTVANRFGTKNGLITNGTNQKSFDFSFLMLVTCSTI